jgi:hypothetical protein
MEEGFITTHDGGAVIPETWMSGAPHKYAWDYTKEDQATLRQIKTYCCTRCGYLESYANS